MTYAMLPSITRDGWTTLRKLQVRPLPELKNTLRKRSLLHIMGKLREFSLHEESFAPRRKRKQQPRPRQKEKQKQKDNPPQEA